MLTCKEDLLAHLASLGLETETVEHPPLHTVEESQAWRRDMAPGGHFKNLFLKDREGQLWLIVALEETKIRLNKLYKRMEGAAQLSFASAELMEEVLGVKPGSVTPFALANDKAHRVRPVFDKGLEAHERLYFHPLDNRATTAISRAGFMAFLADCGHEITFMVLDEEAEHEAGQEA